MIRFELGSKLKCKVTGFKGIAVARIEFLNGCVQYGIKPKSGKEGKMPETSFIDVQQLELLESPPEWKTNEEKKSTGGENMDVPKKEFSI